MNATRTRLQWTAHCLVAAAGAVSATSCDQAPTAAEDDAVLSAEVDAAASSSPQPASHDAAADGSNAALQRGLQCRKGASAIAIDCGSKDVEHCASDPQCVVVLANRVNAQQQCMDPEGAIGCDQAGLGRGGSVDLARAPDGECWWLSDGAPSCQGVGWTQDCEAYSEVLPLCEH